jgi:hypothetical protein
MRRSGFNAARATMIILAQSWWIAPFQRCEPCELKFEQQVLINGRIEQAFDAMPRRVILNDHQYVVVLDARRTPPKVFDTSGQFIRQLGGSGRGPGETVRAAWLDWSLDDSVRVYEAGRVIAFDSELKAGRTTTDRNPQSPRYLTPLAPGVHALISARYATMEAIANPIVIRTDSGATLATIPVPRIDGRLTSTVFTRDLASPRRLWMVEYQEFAMSGYRIVRLNENQSREVRVHRSPDWWQKRSRRYEAASLVRDVRQVDSRTLAVLSATPRRDWRSIPYDTLTNEGYWERLDTVVELIDIQTRAIIASGRLAGAPISFASESAVATYREDAEGYPKLVISRFSVR